MDETDGTRMPIPRTPRAEVRRRLLATAGRHFADKGYAAARVDDIAQEAGFTKGAVYSNFESKQGLLAAVLQERADVERRQLLSVTGHDGAAVPEQVGQVIAHEVTHDTERGRLGVEFAAQAAGDAAVADAWREMRRIQRSHAADAIVQVTEAAGLALPTSPEIAALILHCLTNGLAVEHLADPERVDETAIRQVMTTVLELLTRPRSEET